MSDKTMIVVVEICFDKSLKDGALIQSCRFRLKESLNGKRLMSEIDRLCYIVSERDDWSRWNLVTIEK